MKHPNLFKLMGFLTMTVLAVTGAATATAQGNLVLWNKLGSQSEIENSSVGLHGTFSGGGFVAGMFGDAFVADYTQIELVTFPKEAIPGERGAIGFWAKLIGFPPSIPPGDCPSFIKAYDGHVAYHVMLAYNDGLGGGGISGSAGHGASSATGGYGSWSYEQILGAGEVEAWHHYALVWDKDGIPGVDNGSRKVAVFLDGQLDSTYWREESPDFVALTGSYLGLVSNNGHLPQGSVAIDNIKIWDSAKIDFSDRFDEAAGADPELSIASEIPAAEDRPVEVDVVFTANDGSVAATTFSLDYDENCLFFDDIDFDPVDGTFDNVAVHVPGDFSVTMFHDLGDSDGELDFSIVDLSPPIATLPDGPLVTVTFTPTCSPVPPGHTDAAVGFSTDPAASFSDDAAQDIDGTTASGSVRIYPGPRGDCNLNGSVTAADLVAIALEIFDGDGSFWGDVPGGTFAGSPVGCDANADTESTAGDVSCIVRLIFGDTCGSGSRSAAVVAGRRPVLEIDGTPRLERDSVVRIPVRLRSRGLDLSSVAFSLDLETRRLRLDPGDGDRDGIPDAISFPEGRPWFVKAGFDARDRDSELDLVLGAGPGAALADGLLLEIEVTVLRPGSLAKSLRFSEAPAASFGDEYGQGVAGSATVVWKRLRR